MTKHKEGIMDGTKKYFDEHYSVKKIKMAVAKEYMCKNHYTHGCHNAPNPCYGLYEYGKLIGAIAFSQPCSENVRSSIWGKEFKNRVIELHRLHIMDTTPRNTETWFMSRCFEMLKQDKPEIKGIISFSDTTEGHIGTIYKAMNFYFVGKTSSATFYRDQEGRLRHPRQNGVNISKEEALTRGWTIEHRRAKNRYLYLLPENKREKRTLLKTCRYDVLHYKWCPICGKAHLIGEECKCQARRKAG